jgi:hypothetical protein
MEQAYTVQQQRLAAINTALTYEEHASGKSTSRLFLKRRKLLLLRTSLSVG